MFIIIISKRLKINPDNIATPIASSLGDVVTLAILAGVGTFFYKYSNVPFSKVFKSILAINLKFENNSRPYVLDTHNFHLLFCDLHTGTGICMLSQRVRQRNLVPWMGADYNCNAH